MLQQHSRKRRKCTPVADTLERKGDQKGVYDETMTLHVIAIVYCILQVNILGTSFK